VYVDAFNLYYRALQGTPYKWLDILKLCRLALPKYQIHRIRYFTALIRPRPSDPRQPQRQQAYIRALLTLPKTSVHYGTFLSNPKWLPLYAPVRGLPGVVQVLNTEEKGSDVNLATFLLCDGYENDYQAAIVISNDSDLVTPIEVVRSRLMKPVVLLSPANRPNVELVKAATFVKAIRKGVLAASQFPLTLQDVHGTITKPPGW
jgi:hypothetical protein